MPSPPAQNMLHANITPKRWLLMKQSSVRDDLAISDWVHDKYLECTNTVWKRCEELHLTLNKAKSKLCQNEITFLEMRRYKNGSHPTFDKLQALKQMHPPTRESELRGFLSLLNPFSTFIPNLSERTKKMRHLFKKKVPYTWNDGIQAEFNRDASRTVPTIDMREELLDDAHKLHPGIVMVKRFIRKRAWRPGLDAESERLITKKSTDATASTARQNWSCHSLKDHRRCTKTNCTLEESESQEHRPWH